MKIAKSAALALLLCSCTSVQTRTKGDLLVYKDEQAKPEIYGYEAVESHDIGGLALWCGFTAIFYGGACWGYLAQPGETERRKAIEHAKEDALKIGRCAKTVGLDTSGAGWSSAPRVLKVLTASGRALTEHEVDNLCVQQDMKTDTSPES